jgi:hypothetical protein
MIRRCVCAEYPDLALVCLYFSMQVLEHGRANEAVDVMVIDEHSLSGSSLKVSHSWLYIH